MRFAASEEVTSRFVSRVRIRVSIGAIADVFNDLAAMNQALVNEISTARTRVGHEGGFAHRASISRARGAWKAAITDLNHLIATPRTMPMP